MTETTTSYLLRTSKNAAIYFCYERAIPYIGDGLKPSQRIALWVMRNKNDKIKTFSLAGEMASENLYVHGEKSATDMISRMAAPYMNNICFFDGVGTFGTRLKRDGWGAPRYTYVKNSDFTKSVILVDLPIVPLENNYDESTKQPIHFLPLIPLVLLNGISGIATGYATNILSYNFTDIVDSCISVLDNKELSPLLPYYDGYNVEVSAVSDRRFQFDGKFNRINSTTIQVTELPPFMSLEKFKSFLIDLEEKKVIRDFSDESTSNICVDIIFTKESLASYTDHDLILLLKLREYENQLLNVVNWDVTDIPTYDDVRNIIIEFVNWRLGWYTNRYKRLLDIASHELKYWKSLLSCWDNELPKKIYSCSSKEDLLKLITNMTGESDINILKRISSIETYKWTGDGRKECIDNIETFINRIKEFESYLNDNNKRKQIYKKELMAIRNIKWRKELTFTKEIKSRKIKK